MLGNALSYRTLIPLRLQQAQGTIICLRTQRQAPSHTEFQVHLSSFIACCTSVCDIMGLGQILGGQGCQFAIT